MIILIYTFISETFEGKQSSIIKCLNCENVLLLIKITQNTETYFNLSVDVEQNTSLTFCLKKYISKGKQYITLELLNMKDKFYCNICNSLEEAERQ